MAEHGQLEYYLDFSTRPMTGSIEDYCSSADLRNPLAALSVAALFAIRSEGQLYETESDLSETGSRAEAIDTPAGAGRAVMDLMRFINHAQENGVLMESEATDNDRVTTTLFTPLANKLGQRWGEILGSMRHQRSVQSIAIEYTRRTGQAHLSYASDVRMSATLSESLTGSQVSVLFTNVSSRRITKENDPDWRRLSVVAAQLDHYTLRKPDMPASFQHVRRWAQAMSSLIEWHREIRAN